MKIFIVIPSSQLWAKTLKSYFVVCSDDGNDDGDEGHEGDDDTNIGK